jgi:hypothetical protein
MLQKGHKFAAIRTEAIALTVYCICSVPDLELRFDSVRQNASVGADEVLGTMHLRVVGYGVASQQAIRTVRLQVIQQLGDALVLERLHSFQAVKLNL